MCLLEANGNAWATHLSPPCDFCIDWQKGRRGRTMLAARKMSHMAVMCHWCPCDEWDCCDTQLQDAKFFECTLWIAYCYSINGWYSCLSGMLLSHCSYVHASLSRSCLCQKTFSIPLIWVGCINSTWTCEFCQADLNRNVYLPHHGRHLLGCLHNWQCLPSPDNCSPHHIGK